MNALNTRHDRWGNSFLLNFSSGQLFAAIHAKYWRKMLEYERDTGKKLHKYNNETKEV